MPSVFFTHPEAHAKSREPIPCLREESNGMDAMDATRAQQFLRFTPCHSTAPQHSDLQEHKQCPQPDEKHEITENHWKSLKLKNLTSPPVHTKNKTTEGSPTFAIFFQRQSEYILTIFTVQSTTSFITAQWNKNPPTFN